MEVERSMEVLFLIALAVMAIAIVFFLFFNSVLVLNSMRYMAVAPSMLWKDSRYIRALPDLLKVLYDEGFISPWPDRPTACSAMKFRKRLKRTLHGKMSNAAEVIGQHLGLWAFIELHRQEIQC